MISEIFGREEKEMESRSSSQSHYGSRLSQNHSVSVNRQEKQVVRPQDLGSLREGEFIGTAVEGKEPFFWNRIKAKKKKRSGAAIHPFTDNVQVGKNYEKIRAEAERIVTSYSNSLNKPERKKRRN
jgi:hypothetical protein